MIIFEINSIVSSREKQVSEEENIGRLTIIIGIFSFLDASIFA